MQSSGNEGTGDALARALQIAHDECVRLYHREIEPTHLFFGLLEGFPGHAQRLFEGWRLGRSDLLEAVRAALPPASPRQPNLPADPPQSLEVVKILMAATELAGEAPVRFEHVMLALLRRDDNLPKRILRSFGFDPTMIDARAHALLREEDAAPQREAGEDEAEPAAAAPTRGRGAARPEGLLDEMARDLVAAAEAGELDPVFGREREIDAVLETLSRRSKNNPVLVGEPGVGKSAIIEGLAQRIATHAVPRRLQNLRIYELSVADLVAGTQYRGQFEERINKLVEATAADPDAVLFIDEIHTILSTGGQPGTGDAASLLKPHLARGTLRCIGATTTDEYRKFLEKDRALVRRFQPINVPEPTAEEALAILRGLAPRIEEHHGITIRREALEAAVSLSKKHLPERHLPDKAIDLVDQASARKTLHGEDDAKDVELTAEDVVALLRDQLGKKLGEITLDESKRLLGIEDFLRARIVGQDHVLTRVAERIRLARRELDFRPERPNGVFLFLGPTGVGKTEVARCLAEYLLGSPQQLLRYDLSEFSEPHSVAKIIGAPPGYVGYEDEGHQLTSRIRSHPQSILLLDEIEKAHPSVLNLFLQVFEDGRMTDAQGRTVSFSEVSIVLTSNIGAHAFREERAIGFGKRTRSADEMRESAREVLKDKLPPELLNRVDEVLIFSPLPREAIHEIAVRLVARAVERFSRDNKTVEVDASAVKFLGESGYDPAYGARHLQRNVEQLLLQPLARETYLSDWGFVDRILVTKRGSALVFEKVYRNVSAPA